MGLLLEFAAIVAVIQSIAAASQKGYPESSMKSFVLC